MRLLPSINILWRFLIAFCLCFFLETITSTYLISCIQSIERQFQITSKLSGILFSCGDAGYMLTVVLLAYLGSRGNRPRWIGSGFLVTSLACFLIALPSFIFQPHQSQQFSFSNDSFGNLRLPDQLITYEEVDTVSKLLAHPHIGCSIRNWEMHYGVQLPKRWLSHVQSDQRCTDGQTAATFELPGPLMEKLLFYYSQASTYEVFARHVVDVFNSFYTELNQLTWQRYKEGLHNLSKLPSYCSRLVNHVRLLGDDQQCEKRTTNEIAFAFLLTGMMLNGIGHSVPWTLGVPLIDDCVKKSNAPAYFSGVFFIKILGPMVGFFLGGLCNHLYYNLSSAPAISYTDVNWVGAWWLGFLVVFVLLPAPAMVLLFMPRLDPLVKKSRPGEADGGQRRIEAQSSSPSVNNGSLSHEGSECGSPVLSELRRFVFALVLLFKSPVYMLSLVGRLFEFLSYKGYAVFQTKYLEGNFDLPVRISSFYLGIFDVVMFAAGTLLGSFLMRKLRLQGRKAAAFVATCTGVCTASSVLQIFLSCNFAKKSLSDATRYGAFTFNNTCNKHCGCDPHSPLPVCSSSGQAYFSPCHAGCQTFSAESVPKNFTDCFCVDSGSYVNQENCTTDCRTSIILYFTLISISGLASGISMLPSVFITLRSVPIHLKSVALGLSGFLLSLLSTLPSPVIYGHVIDSTCLLWKKSCGKSGSCSLYDVDALRTRHISLHASLRIVSLLFDMSVIYWAKGLRLLDEPSFEGREAPEEAVAPTGEPAKTRRYGSLYAASRTARRTFRRFSHAIGRDDHMMLQARIRSGSMDL